MVVGHKGKQAFRVRAKGLECHSSLAPQGVNAVDYAAELVVFIRDLARRTAQEGRRDEAYEVPDTTRHTMSHVRSEAVALSSEPTLKKATDRSMLSRRP